MFSSTLKSYILVALASTALGYSLPASKSTTLDMRHSKEPPCPFEANSTIVDGDLLYQAVANATNWRLATYPAGQDDPVPVNIYADWLSLTGSSIVHFIADMDVDCDGVSYLCKGNKSGLHETSYGHLDASVVPYYVVPARFYDQFYPKVQANALGAIICNGKIFYGILGDTNGAEKQIIGEASYILARNCFPDDNLDGNRGHPPHDVGYVIFGNQVPEGVEDKHIDLDALKSLGDEQLRKLVEALGLH